MSSTVKAGIGATAGDVLKRPALLTEELQVTDTEHPYRQFLGYRFTPNPEYLLNSWDVEESVDQENVNIYIYNAEKGIDEGVVARLFVTTDVNNIILNIEANISTDGPRPGPPRWYDEESDGDDGYCLDYDEVESDIVDVLKTCITT